VRSAAQFTRELGQRMLKVGLSWRARGRVLTGATAVILLGKVEDLVEA
jgi:hypothetical protein